MDIFQVLEITAVLTGVPLLQYLNGSCFIYSFETPC